MVGAQPVGQRTLRSESRRLEAAERAPDGRARGAAGQAAWPSAARRIVDEGSPDVVVVVDGAGGRVVEQMTAGEGVLGVVPAGDGSLFMLGRRSSAVEIWDAEQQRRLMGSLAVPELVAGADEPDDATLTFDFVSDGSLLAGVGSTEAHGLQLRWYRPDSATPEQALDLARPIDLLDAAPQPVDVSADGDRLLLGFRGPSTTSGMQVVVLDLAPEARRDEICRQIGGRRFTDDELAAMPAGTGSLTWCRPARPGERR